MEKASLIRVLVWADLVSVYAMWVMMTYLTDVWKLSFSRAAGTINIWGGVTLTMPLGFAYLVDTVLSNYSLLACSSIAYSLGLGLLSMSTPPVLSKSTGTCSKYEPECISQTQKVLFYVSLALIAIGVSGHAVSLKSFIKDNEETANKKQLIRKRELVLAFFAVVGGIALPYIKPWSLRFGIPAICMTLATIVFFTGSCRYNYVKPMGSPITNVFRVLVASILRRSEEMPSKKELLDNTTDHHLCHTDGLRWLDKAAAIILPDQERKVHRSRWKECTITEVEETKIAIRMIPLWLTFILCGTVMSVYNTFYEEQAKKLDRQLGSIKVPLPILLLIQDSVAKPIFNHLYIHYLSKPLSRKRAATIGIAGAMMFSGLCCITAAKMEGKRLHVLRRHDLVGKPEADIPMSIFWLVPQYMLLGGVNSFFEKSVSDFFSDQAPPSMKRYFSYFLQSITGLGYMASVLCVFSIGKISEIGGKVNWFQPTINQSRLDNYFWMLAGLCAVNLCFYVLAAMRYQYIELASTGGGGGASERDLDPEP